MKLYMVLLSLILLSFPVVAGPYCINGPVGDLEINITEIEDRGEENNGLFIEGSRNDLHFDLINNGNLNIEGTINLSLLNLETNISINLMENDEEFNMGPNSSDYSRFHFEIPFGLNESQNYSLVIKAYEMDWQNQTSLESTNCADDSEEIDIVNYRRIEVTNISITPNNLDCDTDSFTVTATLYNNFSHTENISLVIKDKDQAGETTLDLPIFENSQGYLNLNHISDSFNVDNGETKTISHTFDLPGFHLYSHLFVAYPISENLQGSSNGYAYLTIDKCSTDNAQNLQEGVPKLVSKLQRIEDLFTRLCTFLSNQGFNC
jgi:hypothetical protein